MSEIIYYYSGVPINPSTENDIRWLLRSDLQVFNEHLLLCRQKPLTQKIWDSMYGDGTIYSVLFQIICRLPEHVLKNIPKKYGRLPMCELLKTTVIKALHVKYPAL